MTPTIAQKISGLFGLLAVALGAFGAHALKATLAEQQTAEIWETAAFYHLTHAILMFVLASSASFRRGPWLCFALGTVVFSGSLYLLATTGVRQWGAVTPFGGVSLLAGWFWLLLPQRSPEILK